MSKKTSKKVYTLLQDMSWDEVEKGVKEVNEVMKKLTNSLKKIIDEVNTTSAKSRGILIEILINELAARIKIPPLIVVGFVEKLKIRLLNIMKDTEQEEVIKAYLKRNLDESKAKRAHYVG